MFKDTAPARAGSVSLRQLRLFEGVGRLQSIRRASDECNLSQPAVTQALAKLEVQTGVTLLDRGTSGSYLNEPGLIFHRRVVRFFAQLDQAIAELDRNESCSSVATVARRLTRAQLRGLLTLVGASSFAEAAKALSLSQASLQRALHDLEHNLGVSLYCRSASGIVIKPEGLAFGRKVKLASHEIECGLREMDVALGRASAKIVIGAMPGGGSLLLASVLDGFIEAHPGACVRIAGGDASELLAGLLSGEVDIVIGLIPEVLSEELSARPLASTPYEIVARRGHRLLHQKGVTLDDLRSCDWIVGTPNSSRRALFDQLFSGTEGPRVAVATCSMAVIRSLLGARSRLTLMTSYERMAEGGMFAAVPFSLPGPAPELGVITRRAWLPTSLHDSFVASLGRHMASAHTPYLLPKTG